MASGSNQTGLGMEQGFNTKGLTRFTNLKKESINVNMYLAIEIKYKFLMSLPVVETISFVIELEIIISKCEVSLIA